MKNPKWQCAYPEDKRIMFNGVYLTQWNGYHLTLQQSNGGTISANKNRGYYGDVITLSYKPSADYYFNNWQTTGTNVTGNQIKMTQDATARGVFKWTSASTATNKRLDYSLNNKSSIADYCRYTHFYTWVRDGARYNSYSTDFSSNNKNMKETASAANGEYFAFKGSLSVPSNQASNVARYVFNYGRIGFDFYGVPSANYFPIYSGDSSNLITKITYSSNSLHVDGKKFYVPHNNWMTGTKEIAYAVHSANGSYTMTAYYDGVRMLEVSSRDDTDNYARAGMFYKASTTSYSGGSFTGTVQYQYITSYNPISNGKCEYHLRNFSNLAATTGWASTTGVV